ncbi:MAG: Kojibiose phosphorylase [Anaerocolumna sp.]|jgi:maltose phosphorylase|nr:Kojibiose phosphorylase [Anaerocolumna sp.]
MAKIADKYYDTDPWFIIENDFDPNYSMVSESIFSLGNEFMGVRGYFDEGYSGESLIGNYFNGIYESQEVGHSAYKGMIDKTEFIVNAVDWLSLKIEIDGEVVDLNTSKFKDFKRSLSLRTGVLTRSYIWILTDGRELKLEFERFLSMNDAHMAGQRITLTPLNFSGEVVIKAGLDFSQIHHMAGKNLWDCKEQNSGENWCSILANTVNTELSLYSINKYECNAKEVKEERKDKEITKKFSLEVQEGVKTVFTRIVMNFTCKDNSMESYDKFNVKCMDAPNKIKELNYETIKAESAAWWDHVWNDSDIEIKGDELNQQGIRFCIFQMHQTFHGAEKGSIIGAKGLTGEAYSGNTFWDTETYCLPFYIFNNVEAAKQLLEYRLITLPEAKERAKALDCNGAFYPIATISGRECCSLWQHASLQLQASTAVAYGIWHYETITKDEEFVFKTGLPILVEVSRMLATRGDWNADHTSYGFYGVMGPDEFQMMVNNNCYTNYLGKVTLIYTLNVLNRLKDKDSNTYESFIREHGLSQDEIKNLETIAKHMYIPYDDTTKIFEQHEGYFNLPHIDVDKIPVADFPLYHHWTYDRIYRNDMIKQPDVLMMMLMYNGNFTLEQIKSNYEFYEPRCIHESSLSPSVHSILAVQLQKHDEAYKFFGFATRMDLDNYNRNTSEGLHTTSIAAAWMNIVYGFGGMRSDQEILKFSPSIPKEWDGYSFRIHYKDDVIHVEVDKDNVSFCTINGATLDVMIYDNQIALNKNKTIIKIPTEWRG